MIQIFQYPHKTLNEVSSDWNKEDSINGYNDIEKFEYDMIKLMIESRGMGLAANQIGITKRFFAIGSETFDKLKKPVIMWNPSVVRESEEKVLDEEGCLSFLGVFVKVLRPKKVTVKWQNIKGETLLNHLDGMESKCFQHELDHLNGITFNQKVSKLSWEMANKRAEKIRKKYGKS